MRLLPQVLELGFMEFNLYLESIMTRKIIDQILSIWHAGEGGAKGVCAFLPLPTPNPINHVCITNSTRYGKLILF